MRNPAFHDLLARMGETHDKKNQDYAEDGNPYSNFEFAAEFAGVSVNQVFDVLIAVKQARLMVLTKSGRAPNNESIEDSLLDQAVYTTLKASYGNYRRRAERALVVSGLQGHGVGADPRGCAADALREADDPNRRG